MAAGGRRGAATASCVEEDLDEQGHDDGRDDRHRVVLPVWNARLMLCGASGFSAATTEACRSAIRRPSRSVPGRAGGCTTPTAVLPKE
jgi:hypothetical protein